MNVNMIANSICALCAQDKLNISSESTKHKTTTSIPTTKTRKYNNNNNNGDKSNLSKQNSHNDSNKVVRSPAAPVCCVCLSHGPRTFRPHTYTRTHTAFHANYIDILNETRGNNDNSNAKES